MATLSSANNTDPNNLQATFYGSALESLDLSSTQITTIKSSTFRGAASLATVKLPAGLTTIEDSAFKGTTNLKTLTQQGAASGSVRADEATSNKLTKSITRLGTYAFRGTGLASIDLSDTKVTGEGNATSLGNSVFQQATSLSSLTLPITLTTIPAGMVAGATSLTSLTIPASVTKINGGNGQYPGAFQGSGLESLDLSTATGLAT